ncbi:hypothetical protein L218DRAFT_949604 [Marasmius fiardii PR-910]|nr:hypothetical protein L218DRAFT_949604 [Marasmius fiardii PR-910]
MVIPSSNSGKLNASSPSPSSISDGGHISGGTITCIDGDHNKSESHHYGTVHHHYGPTYHIYLHQAQQISTNGPSWSRDVVEERDTEVPPHEEIFGIIVLTLSGNAYPNHHVCSSNLFYGFMKSRPSERVEEPPRASSAVPHQHQLPIKI